MDFPRTLLITAIIILAVSSGYFKGKTRWKCLTGLGVVIAFYVVLYMM